MSIWERWGMKVGEGRRHERKEWEDSPACLIEARMRLVFSTQIAAAKWAAGKLADDPQAVEDEAVALLVAGFRAGLAL